MHKLFVTLLLLLPLSGARATPCEVKLLPDLKQQIDFFINHTYAVHVTRQFPRSGVLLVDQMKSLPFSPTARNLFFEDSARITVHFAVGGMVPPHPYGNWEEIPYAVLVNLKNVLPGAVNFFAQDLAYLGPFTIPPGSVVFLPNGDDVDVSQLKNVNLVRYKGALRDAIESFQRTHQQEVVQMPPQSGFVGDPAYWNGIDVNSAEFAGQILKIYPHLELTSATDSLFHGGWQTVIGLCRRLDFKEENGAGPLNQWRLLIVAVEHALNQAEHRLRSDSFKSTFKDELQKAIAQLRGGLNRIRHLLPSASDYLPPDGLPSTGTAFKDIFFSGLEPAISLLSDLNESEFEQIVSDIGFKNENLILGMKIEHLLTQARTRPLSDLDPILDRLTQLLELAPNVYQLQTFLDWPHGIIKPLTNSCRGRDVRTRMEKILNLSPLKPLVLKELAKIRDETGVEISYPVHFDSIPEFCIPNFSRD